MTIDNDLVNNKAALEWFRGLDLKNQVETLIINGNIRALIYIKMNGQD